MACTVNQMRAHLDALVAADASVGELPMFGSSVWDAPLAWEFYSPSSSVTEVFIAEDGQAYKEEPDSEEFETIKCVLMEPGY